MAIPRPLAVLETLQHVAVADGGLDIKVGDTLPTMDAWQVRLAELCELEGFAIKRLSTNKNRRCEFGCKTQRRCPFHAIILRHERQDASGIVEFVCTEFEHHAIGDHLQQQEQQTSTSYLPYMLARVEKLQTITLANAAKRFKEYCRSGWNAKLHRKVRIAVEKLFEAQVMGQQQQHDDHDDASSSASQLSSVPEHDNHFDNDDAASAAAAEETYLNNVAAVHAAEAVAQVAAAAASKEVIDLCDSEDEKHPVIKQEPTSTTPTNELQAAIKSLVEAANMIKTTLQQVQQPTPTDALPPQPQSEPVNKKKRKRQTRRSLPTELARLQPSSEGSAKYFKAT